MKFLFLDIDGVLNAHEFDQEIMCGQIHKDKVQRLNRILRETGAHIVLSSAWRYIIHRGEATLAGMEWLLRSHGVLAGRLVGVTRPDTMIEREPYNGEPASWPHTNERGQQISDWLLTDWMAGIGDLVYAAVDDMDLGITEAGHPLVKTDGTVGLTDGDADKLIQLLSPLTTPNGFA